MKTLLFALLLCFASAPCIAQTVTPSAPVSSTENYTLGAGDEIRVSVFNAPDLKLEQKIGAQGDISMPLIGDLRVAGMTTAQLSAQLETRLRDGYVRDPKVSVTVLTYRPFYVVGEVSKPGPYPYQADLTVASAIATAGGYVRGSDRGGVYVRRLGQAEEERVRASDVVALHPGDTVRVGRSALSAMSGFPLGILGLIH